MLGSAMEGFLYESLASELGQAIARGSLRAGDRLPSVRRLAEERSCSVSTVLEAYLRLENAGLIEVRPKSGHFVRRRAHEVVVEPRAARACSRPSKVTVNDAYSEILAALRAPGGYDRHLRRLRASLETNVERYREAIMAEFPEGTRGSAPRGGFVLWVELPPHVDALALHQQPLRRGIVIAPGPLFSARPRFHNFVKLSEVSKSKKQNQNRLRTG